MSEATTKPPVQQFCSDVWWMFLIRGIAVLAFGVFLLVKPGITAIVLVTYMGAYFLVDGLILAVRSIKARKHVQGWGWGLLMGILEILTALVIFSRPLAATLLTASVLVYIVAFMAILFGIVGIVAGIKARKEIKGEWAMIVGGLLAIIFGVLLLMNPTATAVIYLRIMGVFAIIGGITQIVASFNMRQFGKQGIEALDN